MKFIEEHFADPERVARYAEGPRRVIPGYDNLHRLVVQLLREDLGPAGRILVVGAGGGLELSAFAAAEPGWELVGLDPSAAMLQQARSVLGERAGQVELVQGYIEDAPVGPFDAATCLLTLHLIPDDGAKLAALQGIHRRLAGGAPLLVVDNCIDFAAPDADLHMARYARFAIDSGMDAAQMEQWKTAIRSTGMISAVREEQLLAEAGFTRIQLFFAGLSWRGWKVHAQR